MSVTSIEQLYIGYFGRAADPAGLNYWLGQEAAGLTDTQIASSFAVQAETMALYPALATPILLDSSPAAEANFINAIYQNLFGHAADTAGLSYWQGQLTAGVSPGLMISSVISGAQGTDTTALSSKAGVATTYTNAVLTASPTVAWSKNDVTSSKSILAGVTTAATASATGPAITAAISADQSGNTGVTGTTLTLGGGGQVFSPTATGGLQTTGGNLIRGVNGGLAAGTTTASQLTTSDSITGAGGFNTISSVLDTETIVAPVIVGVQAVNIAPGVAGQTFSGASTSGIQTLSVAGGLFPSDGEAAATTVSVVGISTATALGMMNATSTLDNLTGTFTGLAATGNSATLVLSGNGGGTFDTTVSGGNWINTYNVQSTGKSNTVTIGSGDTQLATVNISGSSALTLTSGNTAVTAINGASATGALTITSTTATKQTITGGSGANTITATSAAKGSTLVGGSAGKDTLVFNATVAATTLTGGGSGAGDTIQTLAGGLGNLSTADGASASALTTDVDVVTDYAAGSTTIDLKAGGTIATLSGTQLAAVAASSSLLTAAQLAAKDTAATGIVAFAYGANEYIAQINNTAGLFSQSNNDGLIQLTGAASTFKNSDLVNT